jgi:ribonuclease T1
MNARALLAVLALVLGAAVPAAAQRAPAPAYKEQAIIGVVTLAELPREARATVALIRKGGPYPYARDGAIFVNREEILPKQKRGYYREYTVKTPGERTRGARRIVAGAGGDIYYTDDHSNHFRRIRE